jgi:hypothetical protein
LYAEELNFIFEQTKRKAEVVPAWAAKRRMNMQLAANRPATVSTHTKRSVMSYKAL